MNGISQVFDAPWILLFVMFQPKESVDTAIGDVLARPWLPLPLGLKTPSLEGVLVDSQRQGISKTASLQLIRDCKLFVHGTSTFEFTDMSNLLIACTKAHLFVPCWNYICFNSSFLLIVKHLWWNRSWMTKKALLFVFDDFSGFSMT